MSTSDPAAVAMAARERWQELDQQRVTSGPRAINAATDAYQHWQELAARVPETPKEQDR
jgi:hypothetical protein